MPPQGDLEDILEELDTVLPELSSEGHPSSGVIEQLAELEGEVDDCSGRVVDLKTLCSNQQAELHTTKSLLAAAKEAERKAQVRLEEFNHTHSI